ncbi:vegetative cell wall protein gp1-like [Scophthalmus maximus]|uniref:vegetative cell wall protein gp1-like n=1 Tax=Scophthalmus maximus TaxID=52904 RepID=UPI001FA8C0CE|nr:vegetative cell wall protein gp1-like [Scophthalmus maximus]
MYNFARGSSGHLPRPSSEVKDTLNAPCSSLEADIRPIAEERTSHHRPGNVKPTEVLELLDKPRPISPHPPPPPPPSAPPPNPPGGRAHATLNLTPSRSTEDKKKVDAEPQVLRCCKAACAGPPHLSSFPTSAVERAPSTRRRSARERICGHTVCSYGKIQHNERQRFSALCPG